MPPLLRLPLAVIALALASPRAEAAITITFSFDGTNTIGVISGSIVLPGTPAANDISGGFFPFVSVGSQSLYFHAVGAPSYDSYDGGTALSTVELKNVVGAQFSGTKSFGFDRDVLYTSFDATPGSTYAPTGTFILSNKTLQQAGLGGLTAPVVAYVASNGEQIIFAPVPEPGMPALVASGTALLAIGRRRRRAIG